MSPHTENFATYQLRIKAAREVKQQMKKMWNAAY